ncbi:hypothetical protein R75461_07624 [Paraburkholderia nemoris]|uniref:hypothetical protein n=1 Tax=Paraburkholderia nemoris TaxID=2793076 RepID=UPI001B08F53F|nr:hypothetical protein [Paraburkholderia nemoris]CAE6854207.1 hypothetical protein R75461_07624 [Paraburkholderia nemoris]
MRAAAAPSGCAAGTGGDIAAKIETLKEVAKAYFIRLYMIENGMLPELAQLTTMDEDGKPLVDVYSMQTEHIEQLQKAFGEFFKGLLPITNRANEKFKTVQDKSTTEATDSYSSGSDTSGGDDCGFGGGGGENMGRGEMPDFGAGEEGLGVTQPGERGEHEPAETGSESGGRGDEGGEATSSEPEKTTRKGKGGNEEEEEPNEGDENSGSSIY